MDDDTLAKLSEINAKLDLILSELKSLSERRKSPSEPKRPTQRRPAPTTPEAIREDEMLFARLFDRWLSGEHLEVRNELERMDADTIRRFADANNLNVTAKTPTAKVMELISARFREKKHLLAGMTPLAKSQPNTRAKDTPAETVDAAPSSDTERR